jgi:hypothetical protein
MDEHLLKTLEQAKRKLADQEAAVAASKKFINQLCEFGGVPPIYAQTEDSNGALGVGAIQRDSFYGKSVTTAAREYLEMRKASGLGAATHAEIIEALKTGGFDFTTISPDEVVAQRGVAITLAKNSSIFHKLPNGNWGLLIWYPEAKERKQKKPESPAGVTAPLDPKLEAEAET